MPSGEKTTDLERTTELIESLWPCRVCRQSPLLASKIWMVLSSDPEAMQVPFGEKTTELIEPLRPSRVCRQAPHVESIADFAVTHFGSSFLNITRVKLRLGLKISAE